MIDTRNLARVLAELFQRQDTSEQLLASIGYPSSHLSSHLTEPTVFWAGVIRRIEQGILPHGRGIGELVRAALDEYPTNVVLRAVADNVFLLADGNKAPAVLGGSSILLSNVQDRAMAQDVLRTVEEILHALNVGGDVTIGFFAALNMALHLPRLGAAALLEVIRALKRCMEARGHNVRVQTFSTDFHDYLIPRLLVEGPDQQRFEVNDVPASTPVRDVGQAVVAHYPPDVWPNDGGLVVDRADQSGGFQRLNPDASLHASDVRAEDTLRVHLERTAGCFPAGMLVTLADGASLPIGAIRIGDLVRSGPPGEDGRHAASVVRVHRSRAAEHLLINGGLAVTPTHLIRAGDAWKRAGSLVIGDVLETAAGRKRVDSIERRGGEIDVYNLHLDSIDHSFYVEGVRVHNMDAKQVQEPPRRSKSLASLAIEEDSFAALLRSSEPLDRLIEWYLTSGSQLLADLLAERVRLLERSCEVVFPERCRKGASAALAFQIRAATEVDPLLARLLAMPLVERPREPALEVLISAPGFRAESWRQRLEVPLDRSSSVVRFDLVPEVIGRQSIEIQVFAGGNRTGYLAVDTTVEAE